MISFEKYWPTKKNMNEVCSLEAENIPDSVLLAVHQKMIFSLVDPYTGLKTEKKFTEQDFYDDFLESRVQLGEKNKFVIVEGFSGVGKSHYIKWLYAKLRSHPDANKFNIIWLPKNISLRKVFDLILDKFKDDEFFKDFAEEIDNQFSIADKYPGDSFGNGLNLALTHKEATLRQEINELRDKENPNKEKLKEISTDLNRAKSLKDLFIEPSLRPFFIENTFQRFIKRSLEGQEIGNFENLQKFNVDDLKNAVKSVDVTELNRGVQFYINKLKNDNEKGYEVAVDFLNKLVDESIRGAFNFGKIMSSKSFKELISEIRKKLFTKDKDMQLIFLIEDFYQMTGIQQELLSIFRDFTPQENMCTLRTALAVTDDYFSANSTNLQRATRLSIDKNELNEEMIRAQVVEMIGARLNAARWGQSNLQKQLSNRSEETEDTWVEKFEDPDLDDEHKKIIDSFGHSDKGYSLFPFNKNAIYSMVKLRMTRGQSLEMISRNVVEEILRKPLNNLRDDFIKDEFPNDNFFPSTILNPSIDDRISRLQDNSLNKIKYKNLICHWEGGNPETFDDLSLPSYIYKAFNLKPLKEVNVEQPQGTTEVNAKKSVEILPVPPTPIIEKEDVNLPAQSKKVIEAVDNWHNGNTLAHKEANELRNIIKNFVNMRIDWNKLMVRPKEFIGPVFIIDRAQGNHNATIKLGSYKDSRVTLFFKAAINISWCRSGKHGAFNCTCAKQKNINQKKFMEDYITVINFIDDIIPQVEEQIFKDLENDLISVSKLLERHSKILGLPNSLQDKKGKILQDIFNEVKEDDKFIINNSEHYEKIPALKNWHDIKSFALENRKKYLRMIDDYSCYRQGGTHLDTSILVYDVDRIYNSFKSQKDVPPIAGGQHQMLINDNRLSSITKKLNSEFKIFSETFFEFEENLDSELVSNINNIIKLCRQNNIIPTTSSLQDLKNIFDIIINNGNNELSNYSKFYKNFRRNIDDENLEKNILNLGRLNTVHLYDLHNQIENLNKIINEIESGVQIQKRASGITGTTEIQNDLLKQISINLNTLESLEE